MQHQEDYPPPLLNRVGAGSVGAIMRPVGRGQQQPSQRKALSSAGPGRPLPPHMTHTLPGYGQQRPLFYQGPLGVPPMQQNQLLLPSANPLPPHLKQQMAQQHVQSGSSGPAASRPSGLPDHLQPRSFPQQKDKSSQQQRLQQQTEYRNHSVQQQSPPQQQMQSYPRQDAAVGLGKHESDSQPAGAPPASLLPPQTAISEASYPNQMQYLSSSNNGPPAAASPAVDSATGAAGQPGQPNGAQGTGWYHNGPGQHTQAQQCTPTHIAMQQQQQQQHRPPLQQQQQQQHRPLQQQQQQHRPPLQQQQQQQQRLYEGDVHQLPPHPAAQPHVVQHAQQPQRQRQAQQPQQQQQAQQPQQQQQAQQPQQQQQAQQPQQQPQAQQPQRQPQAQQPQQQPQAQQPQQQPQAQQPQRQPQAQQPQQQTQAQQPQRQAQQPQRQPQQQLQAQQPQRQPQQQLQAQQPQRQPQQQQPQPQQQYPSPPMQQQYPAPHQQYQQLNYQQHQSSCAPWADEDVSGGQLMRTSSTSGQAPVSSPPVAALHAAGGPSGLGPSTVSPASEAANYPQPLAPARLKPASVETLATPVSFVQLVQQPGGIQVDQSGTVRVVALEAAGAPGQHTAPTHQQQQQAAAGYGPLHTQLPVPETHPIQVPRYGSTSAPSMGPPSVPLHVAREAPAVPPQHSYEPQSYQPPAGITVGGGGTAMWEDHTVSRDAAAFTHPHGPLADVVDGRICIVATQRQQQPQPLPQLTLKQDVGYLYEEGVVGRYPGGVGLGERLGSRGVPKELDGVTADSYALSPVLRTGLLDRLGSRTDTAVSDVHGMQLASEGVRAAYGPSQPVGPPAPDEPPLPLADAIKRAEALKAAVAATRLDGELMTGMQKQLAQTCEKRIQELSLALKAAAVEAAAARAKADAAAAAVEKAESDSAGVAEAGTKDDMGDMRAGYYAFVLDRSIRAVWPLETPEHQLFRAAAEVLLLATEGGRCVPVNNEEVQLRAYELVGATLCNVPSVLEKALEIKAAGGASTMTLLRQEVDYFEVKEHTHWQAPRSIQWLVRLRIEKLPSYRDMCLLFRTAIDLLLPAKLEKQQQQQRSGTARAAGGSAAMGRGGGASLELMGREPEGAEERLVLRHVALHLLGCKEKEIGLFTDTIEAAVEALPAQLGKHYGKARLQDLKQLLKVHPFFWVSPKSMYGADGLTCETYECVALHTQTLLEFQYRAKLMLEQEQQSLHPSKKRKLFTGSSDVVAGGALEEWWTDLRGRRLKQRTD